MNANDVRDSLAEVDMYFVGFYSDECKRRHWIKTGKALTEKFSVYVPKLSLEPAHREFLWTYIEEATCEAEWVDGEERPELRFSIGATWNPGLGWKQWEWGDRTPESAPGPVVMDAFMRWHFAVMLEAAGEL